MDEAARTSTLTVASGLRLHVVEWGEAGDPALVLLHGGGLSSREWTELGPRLAEGLHIVSFDARGCGESDPDPERRYGVRTIADDLEHVRVALALSSFVLVGHSFGAVTACLYAAERPEAVNGLVLVDGGPASHTRPSSLENPPLSFATRDAAAAALARSLPQGFPDWYLDARFTTSPDGTLTWRSDMQGRVEWSRAGGEPLLPGLWPYVEMLSMPTIVLHGARSPLFPRETAVKMTEVNPVIRLVDVEGAGHFVHIDRPDAVLDAVAALSA